MTTDILRLIRQKRRLWKKAKHGQSVDAYEAASKELKTKIRAAQRKTEKKLAEAGGQNKKPFYSYVKKKTKTNEAVGPLKTGEGQVITDNTEMADELNKRFSEVFTREDPNTGPTPDPVPVPVRTRLNKTFVTTQKVRAKIKAEKYKLVRTRWHHESAATKMHGRAQPSTRSVIQEIHQSQ
jgi:hypothetical protein